MSETVHLRGKAIKIATGEDCEGVASSILKERNKEISSYYDTALECLYDTFDEEYFYHSTSETLFHITTEEVDTDDEIIRANYNSSGDIEYELRYYNGGAGFSECLEEAMDKLDSAKNN